MAEENTKKRKDAIEEELSEITPVLEKAKEAVGSIKSDNLNEIRSLKMPPNQYMTSFQPFLCCLASRIHLG